MSEQRAGFIEAELQPRDYGDPGWVEAREPEGLAKDRAPRTVRVTSKTFASIYADRGYQLVKKGRASGE